ncbi:MAG: tetratricopeptide repeat protein [candidate division KSB1 bacterium]|nr:tetratricopeptide repeat protein [candidate division KSB1 bacterium]
MKVLLKKAVFTAVLWLLPLVVPAALEGFFRLIRYGGNRDLFVLQKSGSVSEYVLNENFTRRYFFQKGIKTPVPLSQRFTAVKDSLTRRIFCLGESTTQGFPFPPNGAYPYILQNILTDYFPDKKIEVLNCGITGITSHCVLDMEREILDKYQPDALVIYTGHNEFYGVFGRASALSPSHSARLTQLFLQLQNSRFFLFLREGISRFYGRSVRRPSERPANTLMSLMAKDTEILLDSPIVSETAQQFRKNLTLMCRLAQKRGVPIVFCTLVDNLKDLPPFASKNRSDLFPRDSLQWAEEMRLGDKLQKTGQFVEAAKAYRRALAVDSSAALTHFKLAQCLFECGDYQEAAKHFSTAKDLDVVRFRAPSSFNAIIRQVTAEKRVPLADCFEAFARHSPNGIIGKELLLEHVHPNLRGHCLIAETIAKAVVNSHILGPAARTSPARSIDEYLQQCRLTVLDQEVVQYSLFRLTSNWPFSSQESQRSYQRVGNSRTEALARQLIDEGKSNWVELHLIYGSELAAVDQFEEAEAEFLAALTMYPAIVAYDCLGRLYLRLTESAYRDAKDYRRAEYYFKRGFAMYSEGLQRSPDDLEMNMNYALLLLMRADYAEAAENQLRKVIRLSPQHLNAHRLLIELLFRRNKFDQAEMLVRQALERFPNEGRFYTDLALVEMRKGNISAAVSRLEQAARLGDKEKAEKLLRMLRW